MDRRRLRGSGLWLATDAALRGAWGASKMLQPPMITPASQARARAPHLHKLLPVDAAVGARHLRTGRGADVGPGGQGGCRVGAARWRRLPGRARMQRIAGEHKGGAPGGPEGGAAAQTPCYHHLGSRLAWHLQPHAAASRRGGAATSRPLPTAPRAHHLVKRHLHRWRWRRRQPQLLRATRVAQRQGRDDITQHSWQAGRGGRLLCGLGWVGRPSAGPEMTSAGRLPHLRHKVGRCRQLAHVDVAVLVLWRGACTREKQFSCKLAASRASGCTQQGGCTQPERLLRAGRGREQGRRDAPRALSKYEKAISTGLTSREGSLTMAWRRVCGCWGTVTGFGGQ